MKNSSGVIIQHINQPLDAIMARATLAEKCGANNIWLGQEASQRQTAMLLAALAARTTTVALGTAILPIYTYPPVVAAQTALTLDEFAGNRLILGLGTGHRVMGEWMLGARYTRSADAMREYLTIVRALVRDGKADFTGQWFSGHASYAAPRPAVLPIYLGAFSPRMVELAGELADGIVLWLCSPAYLREHVMPALRKGWARRAGGGDAFDVVVMLTASLTADPAADRQEFGRWLAGYQLMDNYRKMLAASGFEADIRAGRPGDAMIGELAAIGSERHIQQRITDYLEAGATQIAVTPMDSAPGDPFQPDRFQATLEAALVT